jgi:hypothetical protein
MTFGNNSPNFPSPSEQVGVSGQLNTPQTAINMNYLLNIVNSATVSAKNKLAILSARRSSISIADMFDMQMLMNHLSQLSEMSSSVVSAANSSISSMARNIKG